MKRYYWLVSVVVVLVFALQGAGASPSAQTEVPSSSVIIDVSKKVLPSVVSIKVQKTVPGMRLFRPNEEGRMPGPEFEGPFEDFFRRFFDEPPGMPRWREEDLEVPAAGSGTIVTADGYILTNNHVIADAKEDSITVVLHDGTEYTGQQVEITGADALTDLAVIKIKDVSRLTAIEWSDSDEVGIGEWCLALGNPFGLTGTVTQGIVSAKHRMIGKAAIEDLIQTTATINPGNSGGPLVNLDGKVIGINMAIASVTGAWQGIGFAIPSAHARDVWQQITKTGKVARGWLGIRMDPVDEKWAKLYKLEEPEGVLIREAFEGDPAAESGVKAYDLVTEVDGEKVETRQDLLKAVATRRVGEKVTLTIVRLVDKKPKTMKIEVTLGERPAEKELSERMEEGKMPTAKAAFDELGLKVSEPEEAGQKGVVVQAVEKDGPADKAGLAQGDVITELNRQQIGSAKDYEEALKNHIEGTHMVKYLRGKVENIGIIETQ